MRILDLEGNTSLFSSGFFDQITAAWKGKFLSLYPYYYSNNWDEEMKNNLANQKHWKIAAIVSLVAVVVLATAAVTIAFFSGGMTHFLLTLALSKLGCFAFIKYPFTNMMKFSNFCKQNVQYFERVLKNLKNEDFSNILKNKQLDSKILAHLQEADNVLKELRDKRISPETVNKFILETSLFFYNKLYSTQLTLSDLKEYVSDSSSLTISAVIDELASKKGTVWAA